MVTVLHAVLIGTAELLVMIALLLEVTTELDWVTVASGELADTEIAVVVLLLVAALNGAAGLMGNTESITL